MRFVSFLRRRTNTERAADLQQIAEILWKRSSTSRFDQLYVYWVEAERFAVQRQGEQAHKHFESYRDVADYIRRFYRNLLLNGSDAPDDIFMDSLAQITKKKRSKTHHKPLSEQGTERLAGWSSEDSRW